MWIQSSGDPKVSVDEGPWRALELGGFQWFFRCQQPTRMIPKVGLCEFLVGIHLGLGKLGLIIGKLRHLQIKLDFLRYWCAGTSPELQTTNHKHQLTTILYIYICIYVRIYIYIQYQYYVYIDTCTYICMCIKKQGKLQQPNCQFPQFYLEVKFDSRKLAWTFGARWSTTVDGRNPAI